jgi:hypothetical protein
VLTVTPAMVAALPALPECRGPAPGARETALEPDNGRAPAEE